MLLDKSKLIDWLKAEVKISEVKTGEYRADQHKGNYDDLYHIYMGRWDALTDLLAIIQDGRFDKEDDE